MEDRILLSPFIRLCRQSESGGLALPAIFCPRYGWLGVFCFVEGEAGRAEEIVADVTRFRVGLTYFASAIGTLFAAEHG